MRVIIDRFEEDKAVIETENGILTVPRALFSDAREGDHVEITVLGKPHHADIDDCDKENEPAADPALEEPAGSSDISADNPDTAKADDPPAEADPHSIFERLRAKRKQKS